MIQIISQKTIDYWLAVNKTILPCSKDIDKLWNMEKCGAIHKIDSSIKN